jgi:Flp pilus assembly protein TadD
MKNHRAIWTIAGTAFAIALAAFFARQVTGGRDGSVASREQAERDRLVGQMLEGLDRDHRARFASTRALVERVARYCDTPALASAETWYAQGLRKFYGEFEVKEAEEAFTRAGGMRPEWAWPVNALGIVQFVSGRREEALRSFGRALELEPGWSRPHSDLAILYRRAGEMGEALAHAERALAIEPDDLVNQFNYGVVLDDLGRHAEARERYERVLAAAPDMAQAAYNLGCSYAREGDAAKALPYLKRAIEGDPAFREDAADDADFDPIRGAAEFVKLLEPPAGPAAPR